MTTIAASADVADDATIGEGSKVWHLAQVREGARLGENCIVGRGAYIGSGVCRGLGKHSTSSKRTWRPRKLARRSVKSRRRARIPSSVMSPRRASRASGESASYSSR